MRWIVSWLKQLLFRRRTHADLSQEMQGHLEERVEELVAGGVPHKEAAYQARREFGNVTLIEENGREVWRWPSLEDLLADLRFALRLLRKNSAFTAIVALTLALGIGANTAVFSLVNTVLLRPLPYLEPERLVLVSESVPQLGSDDVGVAAAEYLDYRDRNSVFSQTGAYETDGLNLTGEGAPLRVNAVRMSASAFALLGVKPRIGRTFTEEEDRYGASSVLVLSHKLWENHYGSDPEILGKVLKLNEQPYTVVGVMPASFQFPLDSAPLAERADLWVPETFSPDRLRDRLREFGAHMIGRLRSGVTEQQAQADVTNIAANFMRQYPETYTGTIRVVPKTYSFAQRTVAKARPFILLLGASVICVLLIACANVANLLLAKAGERTREMAVRRAVGAGRSRLLQQCLVESLLLSLLGGAAGLFLAFGLIDAARRFGPGELPQLRDVTLSGATLVFTFLISVLTSVLFGLAPAWRISRTAPQLSLKESTQIGKSRAGHRLQNLLCVAEMAVALVLLIGGSLLLQSFLRLLRVPMGFRPDGAVVVRTFFDLGRYPDSSKRETVQKEILEKLDHLPAVTATAAASHLPLSDSRQIAFVLEFEPPNEFHWAQNSLVSPGYFQAMGIPLVQGRDFTERDGRNSPNVAIVSETFAKKFLSGREVIGQRFFWGGRGIFAIVGVAADVHISALDADPPPMIYNSMFQIESGASARTAFVLRLAGATVPQGIASAAQEQIWSLDKDLPVYGATTLAELLSESVAQRRFTVVLMSGFAALALLVAVIGLFGVISYVVGQRRKELAVRMALGAERAQIGWMVLKQATMLGAAGGAIGILLFVMVSPLFTASLFHISRFDPLTLSIVPALLIVVAVLSAYGPARRAMRVDPMVVLRYE